MINILEIRDIWKSFGDTHVLCGINITIEKGKVYTLMGGNGSGKTTLFNIISGFIKPTKGHILFYGKDITRISPYNINRLGIGRTFQDLRLATKMTVYENLLLAMEKRMFYRKNQQNRIEKILSMISLKNELNELAGEISYGQQKLLTIGCCILNDADLLLIDEPVAGIDIYNQQKIISLISYLKQMGKTIIQIEHDQAYIELTSDSIIRMGKGHIIC